VLYWDCHYKQSYSIPHGAMFSVVVGHDKQQTSCQSTTTADTHAHCIAHDHSVSGYDQLRYRGCLTKLDDLWVQQSDWVAVLVGSDWNIEVRMWSCLPPWGMSVGLSKGFCVHTCVEKNFNEVGILGYYTVINLKIYASQEMLLGWHTKGMVCFMGVKIA
jgi:hypothetical protein